MTSPVSPLVGRLVSRPVGWSVGRLGWPPCSYLLYLGTLVKFSLFDQKLRTAQKGNVINNNFKSPPANYVPGQWRHHSRTPSSSRRATENLVKAAACWCAKTLSLRPQYKELKEGV